MKKEKKEVKKGQMKLYSEHMIPLTDKEGNEIKDENGNSIPALDLWSYCEFFAENIQMKTNIGTKENPHFLYDGLSLYDFADQFEEEKFQKFLLFFMQDEKSYQFQLDMEAKYNVKINAAALCVLCHFISKIVTDKYVMLLNPSLKETLESISDLKEITFENADGTKHSSQYSALLDSIMRTLKEKEKEELSNYSTYKLVKREEAYTREIIQAEFVYYLSHFFHERFDIPRKFGGLISVLEQEMVCYYLWYFGLSSEKVGDSRFRQLKNVDQKKLFNSSWVSITFEDKGEVFMQLDYVKHKYWKSGKINVLKVDNWNELEKGAKIFLNKF